MSATAGYSTQRNPFAGAAPLAYRPLSAIAATTAGGVPQSRIKRVLAELVVPLQALHDQACTAEWHWGQTVTDVSPGALHLHDGHTLAVDWAIDVRGTGARASLPVRGVRGELVWLHAPGVRLTRPVRLLHPRTPIYIVPRGQDVYMVGATMVESDDPGPVTARAVMELLAAAYTLHPAFAEAQLLETGAGLRPAYADNLPRLTGADGHWQLNGCYRHGFLLAPALAEQLATRFAKDPAHAH